MLRVAAVGDLHVREDGTAIRELLSAASSAADMLLLCGDLTDRGLPREADAVAEALSACRIPMAGVLGNHDYESGQQEEVARILARGGVTTLDEAPFEVQGVGFAGVKGFAGGFDGSMLQPWGEEIIKRFVQEAAAEAMRLERALARLHSERQPARTVVAFHYSPVHETLEGERPELIPFLGSSRLADPLDRFGVAAAFHSHAHYGSAEGRTGRGVPVYNVSLPALRRLRPGPPLLVINV